MKHVLVTGGVLGLFADTKRINELLGFQPEITLKEGLARLKNWCLDQPSSPEDLLKSEKVRNWENYGTDAG